MNRRGLKMRKAFHNDNRGIALASVMIVMTVCLLIATIVLEITYTSLMSRRVNKFANNNFYTSESALGDIETVLQNVATFTMQQMKSGGSTEFIDTATDTIVKSAGATSLSDTDAISRYLFSQLDNDTKKMLGKLDSTGNYVYDDTKFKVTTIQKKTGTSSTMKSRLVFGVELKYLDPDTNYETNIHTDLVMNDVVHRTPAAAYSLGSYAMFTGGGANFSGNGDTINGSYSCFLQEGNSYIGMMSDEAPTSMKIKGCSVVFDGNRVIINGDVYVEDGALIFSGEKITSATSEQYTEIDIRGTLYINKDAVVVISDGVDLMVRDIVLVDGATKKSVFTDGVSYLNVGGNTSYNCLYPYQVTKSDDLKGLSEAQYVTDWHPGSRAASGCIMGYSKDSGTSTVLEYKSDGKWYYAGTNNSFGGLINYSTYFMPSALTTVYGYDGTKNNVDSEMSNFINMEVLYWQYKNGNGGPLDYSKARYIKSIAGAGGVSRGSITYTNPAGYTFKDVSVIDGITTSKIKSSYGSLLKPDNYYQNIVSGKTVLGKSLTGAVIFVGSNGGFVVNDAVGNNALSLTTAWAPYTLGLNTGSFVGLNLSASKISFTAMGKGVVTSYSMVNGSTEGDDLEEVVDSLKYLNFLGDDILGKDGNGTQYYNITGGETGSWNEFYALGSIDSLYKGGLDAFFSESGSDTSGGDVTVSSSNMYNFITVENWNTK